MKIGFHASHEQFDPTTLLKCVRLAEDAGFDCVSSSDHFHPWNECQGQSGFLWSWLGAALAATSVPFRTVSAPGYRYHPAILAQAGATLAFMYPERLSMALGSGEHVNEAITGLKWPCKDERNARLLECVSVMRALWRGETVTHHGLVTVEEAKLYTLPAVAPAVIGAAVSQKTARWAGSWADGLITVAGGDPSTLAAVVSSFREGGGTGPIIAQVKLAWGPDEQKLRHDAFRQWGTNLLPGDVPWELRTPRQFEDAASRLDPSALDTEVRVSTDLAQHVEWLRAYASTGVDELILHNVATNQEQFIQVFGADVIPALR